ncbi:MAG: MFS transporter [Desulfobacterales bacterium]
MSADQPIEADPAWKRTLAVMVFCQVISSVGFSSVFPFLPLYVRSLGSATGTDTDLLSGLVFSGQAFSMALASPFWGALADRWGKKLMVERAMFGGALLLGLMAFVRSAEELVLLRTLQGMVTGTIAAANALVAAAAPRERSGWAMGLLQVGLAAGVGLGPVIGGAVADAFGYAAAFHVTSGLLALAGVIVAFGVREPPIPAERPRPAHPGFRREWRHVLGAPGVLPAYLLRFIDSLCRMAFVPILPLFALELLSDPAGVNRFTGTVIGASSVAAAIAAVFLGRLGDRAGHRPIVAACALAGGLAFLLQVVTERSMAFLLLHLVAGIAHGGIVTGVSALLARYTDCGEEGAVYGLDNSVNAAARALAPMVGVTIGLLFGYRSVFAAVALFYLTAALVAFRRLPRPLTCPPPAP